jgi:hypothetical protein
MPQVELNYFSLPYNKLNETTVVTDVPNLKAAGFVIKVGKTDDTCRVNVVEDLLTVINKVKPDLAVINSADKRLEAFCEQIGVTCERYADRNIEKYLLPDPEEVVEEVAEEVEEVEEVVKEVELTEAAQVQTILKEVFVKAEPKDKTRGE